MGITDRYTILICPISNFLYYIQLIYFNQHVLPPPPFRCDPLYIRWHGWLVLQSYCKLVWDAVMHVHESAELRIIQALKTSQNTVRFCLFSRLNGYFLHNNTLAIILHVYIMILTWVESIFKLVICYNYTINIIFSSKYRWGSNFRSSNDWLLIDNRGSISGWYF